MSLNNKVLGFIGAGAMAEAIIAGIINSGLKKPEDIWASDCNEHRLNYLKQKLNIQIAANNSNLIEKADVIFLCVKPFVIRSVLEEADALLKEDNLIISVAAGLSTGYISSFLGSKCPVIRVMPNTPSLVGEGASALGAGEYATDIDMTLAQNLFESIGRVVVVREQDMDAVTGLSGSGPAYMYLIIEAMADAGVRAGLTRQVSLELAAQTMYGSAKMVLETGEHPAVLRDKVTTPGGTTITGLHQLEKGHLRATIIDAVLAAVQRSKEMGSVK